MAGLERLRAEHGRAVLAFERNNRAYFAAAVSDRGDDYYDHFDAHLDVSLVEQESGRCAFFVLVDDGGAVLGRFNLYDVEDGSARLGYRVAQHVAGHGVATAAVRELCAIAAQSGLCTLSAAASNENVASHRVLIKAGFVPVGPADPVEIGGRHGTRFARDLRAD